MVGLIQATKKKVKGYLLLSRQVAESVLDFVFGSGFGASEVVVAHGNR